MIETLICPLTLVKNIIDKKFLHQIFFDAIDCNFICLLTLRQSNKKTKKLFFYVSFHVRNIEKFVCLMQFKNIFYMLKDK